MKKVIWILSLVFLFACMETPEATPLVQEGPLPVGETERPTAVSVEPKSDVEILEGIPGVSVNRQTGEITLPAVEGVFGEVPEFRSCIVSGLQDFELVEKFDFVVEHCEGNLQEGNANGIFTLIKVTLPDVRINGLVLASIIDGIGIAGLGEGLQKVATDVIIFNREDGEDGLLGGNIINGSSQAYTNAVPGISSTFTSIPLGSDNVDNFNAVGTEMCQTQLIAMEDSVEAEKLCNSYGVAVSTSWLGWTYDQYKAFMNLSSFQLDSGQIINFEPISEEAFEFLSEELSGRPDILQWKE
ncbi:hypothetical protein KC717_01645 [Candidatus Dojkabacteria bacterium]|uniref:Uncharacterized protein n=1 Tax=Candidatus Dojkabacteria bacterium TaxID=2099670 RepID=A0A955RK21_9BACT|nr:hypothetical protein [Candidatus Dojkabacteria bacterium]